MTVRQTRDPVEICRNMILEREWASEKDLKNIEKEIRARIDKEVEQIKKDPFPAPKELYTDIGTSSNIPIRAVRIEDSLNYN